VRPEDYQAPILCADSYRGLNREEDKIAAFRRGLAIAERHLELYPDDARACISAPTHSSNSEEETKP